MCLLYFELHKELSEWTALVRPDPTHMKAQHTRERIRINKKKTAFSSFKIEIAVYWFHKTKYKPNKILCDEKTLALHYHQQKQYLRDMEICRPPGASEVDQLWLLVTEEVWWEIKQLTRKSQINHFPSINYHFLGCSFDLLLICKDTMAVERNPSLFSPSLCLYWEHLAHIAVNLAFVTSVCSVSLGPAVVAKCSSVQEIWPQPPQPTAQHWLTTSLSLALA